MPVSQLAEPRTVFPFVVGCQRSGTTLLQTLLDGHPELAMAPESHFILPLAKRFANRWFAGPATNEAFADALLARRRFAYWKLTRDELLEALGRASPLDYAGAVRTVYATRAERLGKPGYGDKTPRYVGHLPALAALFPEARFIHLIRDGRDVSLSMTEAFDRGPQTPVEGALFWRSMVERGRAGGRAVGADRYLEVGYEELVEDPPAVIGGVCDFLGIGRSESMSEHASAAARVVAGYPDPGVHRNLPGPIERRRDWRAEMSEADVARFELLAGDLLADLGYPRAAAPAVAGEDRESLRFDVVAREMIALRRRVFSAERRSERLHARVHSLRATPWRRLSRLMRRPLRGAGR